MALDVFPQDCGLCFLHEPTVLILSSGGNIATTEIKCTTEEVQVTPGWLEVRHHSNEGVDLAAKQTTLWEIWKWIGRLPNGLAQIANNLFHCPLRWADWWHNPGDLQCKVKKCVDVLSTKLNSVFTVLIINKFNLYANEQNRPLAKTRSEELIWYCWIITIAWTLETVGAELETVGVELETVDVGLETAGAELETVGIKLETAWCGIGNSRCGIGNSGCWVGNSGCGIRNSGRRIGNSAC